MVLAVCLICSAIFCGILAGTWIAEVFKVYFSVKLKNPPDSSISSTSPTVKSSSPNMAQPTSKPEIHSSTITRLSYSKASSKAAGNSLEEGTFVIPKEEPAFTGFTNSGYPIFSACCKAVATDALFPSTKEAGTEIPAVCANLCARSLSIHKAEDKTPHPTTGIPAISKSP